jgi:hypothetical protein
MEVISRDGRLVVMAAIFDLNHHAGFVHWHFFTMSWPNIIAILLTLIVFAVAILVPFPGGHRNRGGRS